MADENEDLAVEVEQDAALTPEAEPEKPQDDVDKVLADLKAQLADAKAREQAAEARARELADSEFAAKNEVQDSNYNLVVNAIETLKQQKDALKFNYQAALESQDYAAAADIQVAMSDNAAKLLQLENGKAAMEQAPKPQRPQITDPVEALASQLTPRSADWVRRNPQYATDGRLYQKMIAAHNIAVADGHAPDSDGYFDAVETILKPPAPTRALEPSDDPTADAARPMEARSAPPAAPVSRGGDSVNRVRLSSEEVEMAGLMGMTPEEYAKEKQAIQKTKLN